MKRPAIFGAAAVLLFLFTVATVRNYLKGIRPAEPARTAAPATRVVVAADDIPVGTTLAAEHLRTVSWPADAVPAGAPTQPDQIIGWVARASLVRNEPVLPEKLADPNARGVLPLVIPPGMRAASVRVNEVTGISGFVTPGSKVDIIAVVEAKGQAGGARRSRSSRTSRCSRSRRRWTTGTPSRPWSTPSRCSSPRRRPSA